MESVKKPMLSKEAVEEFKAIYKKQFKKDLTDQEALEKATSLINLMRIIYKPMTKDEYETVQKRIKELDRLDIERNKK